MAALDRCPTSACSRLLLRRAGSTRDPTCSLRLRFTRRTMVRLHHRRESMALVLSALSVVMANPEEQALTLDVPWRDCVGCVKGSSPHNTRPRQFWSTQSLSDLRQPSSSHVAGQRKGVLKCRKLDNHASLQGFMPLVPPSFWQTQTRFANEREFAAKDACNSGEREGPVRDMSVVMGDVL